MCNICGRRRAAANTSRVRQYEYTAPGGAYVKTFNDKADALHEQRINGGGTIRNIAV